MTVIGLTGGSGSGKSRAAAIFERYGVKALNADEIYHEILAQKNNCTDELAAAFGKNILDENGYVHRKKLAAAVFGKKDTPTLLHTLNTITHKYVMSEIRQRLNALQSEGTRIALIDAPQLFEAKAEEDCDLTVGVIAARELRLARIMARDGLDVTAAEARINAQPSDGFYRARCDVILENNSDDLTLEKQICELLARLG